MMKAKMQLLMAAALLTLAGCNAWDKKNQADAGTEASVQAQQSATDSLSVFGTYKGTFPCADCGGKDMSLTINNDGTYSLKYKYQDRDERLIEENGVYTILNDTLIETITPSSGDKTYYQYVHGNLVLSDSLGQVNNGELAELYVLKKEK